jgi:hypothetical protein
MSLTHIEQARAEVNAVMADFPDLTYSGFWRKARGEKLESQRALMLTDDAVEQFINAKAWLGRQPKSRTINRAAPSSLLKRIAAHEAKFYGLPGDGYVSNGMLIAAAVATGFTVEPDPPNALLNLNSRALTDHHNQSMWCDPPSRYFQHPTKFLTRTMEARVIAARENERTRMLAEGLSPPEYHDLIERPMKLREIRRKEQEECSARSTEDWRQQP